MTPPGHKAEELKTSRSSIEKLSIQGIRSFSDRTPQTIRFQTPLTLIVGDNGAGKTTIIECLKYSTTGQLPVNAQRNGAFIHDPKLSGGGSDVFAQVKLGFFNASRTKHVITRSIQATVKKTGISQKTIDCMLVMDHNGERTALSTKVAEMDKVVPEQMGVTRAVLENVIFCHQDDSLWPMSEPTVLKKKFDEIFEAQKYTKAIDALKIMGKTHTSTLGKLVIYEENLKSDKDKGERLQKRCDVLQDEIEVDRAEHQEIEAHIRIAKADQKEKHDRKIRGMGIVEELKTNRQKAEFLEGTIESLRTADFEELDEPDEWLQSHLDQFEEKMKELSIQSEEYRKQYKVLQDEAAEYGRQMSAKQSEKGQYQAEKESHERNLESRVQLVKKAALTHSIRGFEGEIDDHQVLDFVDRVQKKTREKDAKLEREIQASNDEQRKTQAALSELDNLRSTRTHERLTASQAISANDKKVSQKQKDLSSIRMHEGEAANLTSSLDGVKGRLNKARSSYEAADWSNSIEGDKKSLEDLKSEMKGLRDEEKKIRQFSTDYAALAFQQNEAKIKQKSLDVMVSTYTDRLNAAIGSEWRPGTLEQEFQAVLDQRSRTLSDAKKLQEGAHQELREQEIKLKTARDILADKKAEIQTCHSTVLNSIFDEDDKPLTNIDDFLGELQALEKERDEVRQNVEGRTYVSDYYRQGIEVITKRNCCRLCERPFADKKERASASDKIEKALSKLLKEELEKELKDLDIALKTANAARVQYDIYKKLHEIEVPALQRDVEKLEYKKKSLVRRLEQCDLAVSEEESAKRDIETLSTTVRDITKYYTEISDHKADIERLSSQQKMSGNFLSADEIEAKVAACDERIQIVETKLTRKKADHERAQAEIRKLEMEASDTSNNLNMANVELEKRQRLLGEIKELQDDTSLQRRNIRAADEALGSLGPQYEKAKRLHEDAQRRGREKAKIIQDEKTKLDQTVNQFKLIENSINAYIENGGPGKLATCQRAIKTLELEHKQIQTDMAQVTTNANSLNKKMEKSEHTKRVYYDNIRYRKTLRDLEDTKREIADLVARNVTDDFEKLSREAAAADNVLATLQMKDGPLRGKMKAKDDQLMEMWREYERDYVQSADKYKEMHIKVETTKAAIDDMKKYREALDNAIMRYHTLKMEEINAIAGELWRSTYQGTDVDTIKIRSESEASTSSRSAYNYRVVMVKQDAEMDMRGRCSAGQRVLASIIIRLALAESFGANCGVIALDEPTTNLDKDNIRALAESLNKIIRQRQNQSNFQLVIITHDEEFLREMKCSEFNDHYYHITRDSEQKSRIDRESLGLLM